jgi:putative hemolysin
MASSIFILFILLLINGTLAMAEIALISARKTKLEVDAERGDRLAGLAFENSVSPSRILSTIQVGITLIGILTGVYSGEEIAAGMETLLVGMGLRASYSHPLSLTIIVILVTFVFMLVGELVPKRIGLTNPEEIAKAMVRPLLILANVTHPFTWVLSKCGDGLIHLLGIKPSAGTNVTEEEIKAMVQEGAERGEVQEIEQDIVERVFHLGDRKISSLMTHHSDLIWLDIHESDEEQRNKIKATLHSVYPVCDGDLDKVLGVVYIKDLISYNATGAEDHIVDRRKPAQFVLETLSAYETLELFKQNKIHYGLVIDEYGSTVGMVTLNDILEALVGDFSEPSPDEPKIIRRDDSTWLADGHMSFYEFAYEFDIKGFDKSKVKFDTLAGLAVNILKHIPRPGEKFTWRGFEFEILDLDGNRIDKLLIKQMSTED